MKTFISMTAYIRRNFIQWSIGLFVPALASLATNLTFARCMQNYSEHLMGKSPSFRSITFMLILTSLTLLLFSCIDDVGKYVFSLFFASTEKELRKDFYHSLIRAPMQSLQEFHQGELLSRYHTDITQSTHIAAYDLHGALYPLIVGCGCLCAVFLSNQWIGILMLLLGVSVIVLNVLYLQKLTAAQQEFLSANEEYTLSCSNAINGKMTIRQYAAESVMSTQIQEASATLYLKERRIENLQARKQLTCGGLSNICTYLLTPAACILAVYGYITVPVVLFIHQICRYFIMYTHNFAAAYLLFCTHALSHTRISRILELPDEAARNGKASSPYPGSWNDWRISFEKVSVSYKDAKILNDVTFSIKPGEITALIGKSGCGKTTLVKTLLQMTDYQGKIFIGQKDCSDIPVTFLREHIAFSPEHSELFHTSVYENIKSAHPNASDEAVYSAAGKAAIIGKDGFLYRDVGKGGEHLSGGEKQRVSLARAFLKNAEIIVLDEPTAALDAESERKILHTILTLKQEGKCILLITHKASTLRIADKVFRLENGTLYS